MSKFSVKKPLTVIMALIMVIILGYVSFTNMQTDLLPNMELPYVAIITTYVGATPEKVEISLTKPLEQILATTSGIENISSVSSENYSMIMLEFSRASNLDSAIIEMSSKVNQVIGSLGNSVGTPMYMKINPDMIPVTIASVDIKGLDREEIAKMVSEEIIPRFERIGGVASVSSVGLIEKTMKITINQDKLDELNDKIIAAVDEKLLDAQKELEDAEKELSDGIAELEKTQKAQNQQLAQATVSLQSGITQITLGKNTVDTLAQALEAANGAIDTVFDKLVQIQSKVNKLPNYTPEFIALLTDINTKFATANTALDAVISGLDNESEYYTDLYTTLTKLNKKVTDIISKLDKTLRTLEESKTPAETIAQVRSLLGELKKQCNSAKKQMNTTSGQLEAQLELLFEQLKTVETGKLTFSQEIAATKAKLDSAKAQLETGKAEFEKAKESAYEQAGLSGAITVDTVSGLISAENFSMPVGSVNQDNITYSVKVGDIFKDNKELVDWELFNIPTGDIGVIKLEDIADIEYLDNSGDMYAKVNGNNGILLTFAKQSTYSTTDVAHSIQDKIKELEKEYNGLSITALSDQGEYIDRVIYSVLEALIMGGALAIIILLVFLRDIKPTFIIAISIPASLLFSIVLMYFTNVSLNIISLAGLALGVGMLVDNSIVVVENIYRLKSLGQPIKDAAIQGAKQVAGAIISSTLTTVSVFIPIIFTEGITRQIFSDMGLTIAYSLVASLVVALTLVPALSSLMLKKQSEKKSKIFDGIIAIYAKSLNFFLKRKAVIILLVVAFLGLSIFGVTQMGTEFIPESDVKQVSITLEMPLGSTSEDTRAMCETIIDKISTIDDINTIAVMQSGGNGMTMLGMGSGSDRQASFYLLLKEDRKLTSNQVSQEITNLTSDLDCTITVSSSNMSMSMLTGEGIELVIKGSDIDDLKQAAKDTGEILKSIEGTVDVTTGLEEVTQEVRIIVDKNAAMANGYTVAQVYTKVLSAIQTEKTATSLEIDGDEHAVIVAKDKESAITVDDLKKLEFEVANNFADKQENSEKETVLLEDIAKIEFTDTPNSISHQNQMRTMTVSSLVDANHNVGIISREFEEKLKNYDFPGDCYYETSGENEYITSALYDLVYMLLIAIAFIYMIMVAQFQSFKSPFIVMFTMPLAFTGGLIMLWAFGFNLSIVAMLGFLVLSGVVVNNGIVFVDYANQLIAEGMEIRAALIETGKTRIRPIIMTALTTILGLVTIALGIGDGTDMIQPMGIVVIGGLSYATLLTLFFIPVLYDIFTGKKHQKNKVATTESNTADI